MAQKNPFLEDWNRRCIHMEHYTNDADDHVYKCKFKNLHDRYWNNYLPPGTDGFCKGCTVYEERIRR